MTRPVGVRLTSGVVALSGAFGLVASLVVPSAFPPIIAAISLALVFGAYGLWTLKTWGWALVGGLYLLSLPFNLVTGVADVADFFRLALGACLVSYLYLRRGYFLSDDRPRDRLNARRDRESERRS